MRFRAQEIDELARSRGLGSDPALPLGDSAKGGPASPAPRKKSKIPTQEPIAFIEDDEAPIGKEPSSSFGKGGPTSSSKNKGGPPSSGKSPRPASKLGPQSPSKLGPPSKPGRKPTQTSGAKSPPPKKSSDSDVRLVAEGSDLDFQVVRRAQIPPPGKSGGPHKPRPSKLNNAPDPADSGVRIVPLDDASDSDVKITPDAGVSDSALAASKSGQRPSDSDIRLDNSPKNVGAGKRSPGQGPITEEIDLDAEQARADAAARTQPGHKTRPKPNPLNLPTSSPFELSEADIGMDEPAAADKTPRPSSPADQSAETDSSSDFELTPAGEVDPTPLELSSSEQPALPLAGDDSDEVGLGELTGAGAAQSGINLQDPGDSGISLEQGGSDEIEFELNPDSAATPKPSAAAADAEGSSEFELALGSEDGSSEEEGSSPGDSSSEFELALDSAEVAAEGEEESSSEFELSLDESGEAAATDEPGEASSDSEFELTLDAEGGEASDETDALTGGDEEKDIFETDFEVPALEDEESGSEAVAMEDEDTDLETSDFDLALDEEGASEEDSESGSQVVDLDDEEADEGAETEARPRRSRATAEDEEGELDLEIDPTAEPEEDEEEVAVGAGAVAAPPARWGPLPALLMLPSVIVLFVVGLLTFELVGTMWGYRQPGHTTGFGIVLHPIAKYFDNSLPD